MNMPNISVTKLQKPDFCLELLGLILIRIVGELSTKQVLGK